MLPLIVRKLNLEFGAFYFVLITECFVPKARTGEKTAGDMHEFWHSAIGLVSAKCGVHFMDDGLST